MNPQSPRSIAVLLAVLVLCAPGVRGEPADLRLQVSNKSLGSDSKGNSRTSHRELKILIDNRGTEAFENVTMEWTVVARDINSRKLSIAASGEKRVDIPADTDTEVSTGAFSFSQKEGQIERVKNKQHNNKTNKNRVKVHPDTGTRYAGYVVIFRKGGQIIAESSTAGLKDRIKGLSPKKPSPKKPSPKKPSPKKPGPKKK